MSGFARRLQQAASVQLVVGQDSFNRPDNASALGMADKGGTWVAAGADTWALTGGMAAITGTTNSPNVALLPISIPVGMATADVYLSPGGSNTGLTLLATSNASAYLSVQLNLSNPNTSSQLFNRISISKRVNGTTTWFSIKNSAGLQAGRGYTLSAVVTATNITVFVDGVQQLQYTFQFGDIDDLPGTNVGLRTWVGPDDEDGGSRWDRFLAVGDSTQPLAPHVPAQPLAPTVTAAGSNAAAVSWAIPGNGGSAITGYTVSAWQSSDNSLVSTTPATGTSTTVTGLTGGVGYYFTVSANNTLGASADSAASGVLTASGSAASVPGAPTGVSATAGDSLATVSWTAPASNGGSTITSYTVTSSSAQDGTAHTMTVGGSTTTATVPGLIDGDSYTFTVHATNGVGNSAESTTSNSVTPTSNVTIVAQDDFNRVDGSLGTAVTGGAWSVSGSDTWGISSTMAAISGAIDSPNVALLPVNLPTGTIAADVYTSPTRANTGLALLAANDGSAYLSVQLTRSSAYDRISVSTRSGTTTTWLAIKDAAGLSNDRGYTLAAVLTTTDIFVYVDGTLQLQYTLQAGDLTGLGQEIGLRTWVGPSDEDGQSRWDRFLVTTSVDTPAIRVPATPLRLTAASNSAGSADLTWQTPGNGGSAIISYTLTSSAGYSQTGIDPNLTSYTATGLSGVAQTFTLTAINAAGSSVGKVSNSVTPGSTTVPGAPTNVVATGGNADAFITWNAPVNDGGSSITGYTVTSTPGGLTATTTGATNATVSGLTNGTSYTFTVHATNGVGNSAESAASNSITPSSSSSGNNYLLSPSSYMASDGLPYPDASNTGFTAYFDSSLGRNLQASDLTLVTAANAATYGLTVSGSKYTTTADNQVLTGLDIVGRLVVKNNGVTVQGCRITTTNNGGSLIFGVTDHKQGLTANWTMRYCTLHANTPGGEVTMLNHEWGNVTWCNVSGGTDGWDPWGINNLIFEHNYIHDLTPYAGAHSDCIQPVTGAGPLSIRHNTLLATNPSYPIGVYAAGGSQFPGNTSGMQIGQLTGNMAYNGDFYFEDNLCDGGNYMFNANWGSDGTHDLVGHIYIQNNRFGRDERYGLYTHVPGGHNIVLNGNVWDDNGTSA